MKGKTLKNDIIVIIVLLLIISGLFIFRNKQSGNIIKITKNNKVYGYYYLDNDQTINIDNKNKIIIKNNEAYMKYASCPDKLCIKQGHISKKGSTIVCLPNKIIIEVIEGKKDNNDAKVY